MNRTDRLVAMVLFLQGRRVVRAGDLAAHFGVGLRTVYRDVSALGEAGVPIVGEAGVGYSLVRGYQLPPVRFTADEAAALFIGGEMVKRLTDASLREPADSALLKIRAVLPRDRQDDLQRLERATEIASLAQPAAGLDRRTLGPIQRALVASRVLRLTYRAPGRAADTVREVEPLGVFFHTGVWYLVAWCRLRGDLRHFRLDRVQAIELRPERFAPRDGFSLQQHLTTTGAAMPRLPIRVWFHERAVERARRESYNRLVPVRIVDGGREVGLETFSLDWAARWILSFGPEAEALAPAGLRERVRLAAEEAARRHRARPEPVSAESADSTEPPSRPTVRRRTAPAALPARRSSSRANRPTATLLT